jgi:hypothetical protein
MLRIRWSCSTADPKSFVCSKSMDQPRCTWSCKLPFAVRTCHQHGFPADDPPHRCGGQWRNSGSPGATSQQDYDDPDDRPERDLCLSQPLMLVLVLVLAQRFMNTASEADSGCSGTSGPLRPPSTTPTPLV